MSTEEFETIRGLLERLVVATEAMAESAKPTTKTKVSKESVAIALVGSEGITDLGQIAEKLGCHRRTVERMKTLRAMIDSMGRVGEVRRGFRTADGIDGVN
jgi:ActR/RegA family two-component response regulator